MIVHNKATGLRFSHKQVFTLAAPAWVTDGWELKEDDDTNRKWARHRSTGEVRPIDPDETWCVAVVNPPPVGLVMVRPGDGRYEFTPETDEEYAALVKHGFLT